MTRMNLDNLITGKQKKPLRSVIYGVEGVGKSTWASLSPSPIFLNAEDGTAHLDIARFPEPESFTDIMDAITTLYSEEHEFKTLVLDSVDWAEQLIRAHICEKHNVEGIESLGYGKGWLFVQDEFLNMLRGFDALYQKGMNIIIVAHAQIKPHNDPMLDSSYDRYILKLEKRNEPLLKEWCDMLLFSNFDTTLVNAEKTATKTKGKSFGKRLLFTTRSAAFDAKNRYGLPERMPLDWPTFWECYQQSVNPQPAPKEQQAA